jgi:hypothetical protein
MQLHSVYAKNQFSPWFSHVSSPRFTMFQLGCTSGAFGPPGLRNDQEDSLAFYVRRAKQKAAPGASGDEK